MVKDRKFTCSESMMSALRKQGAEVDIAQAKCKMRLVEEVRHFIKRLSIVHEVSRCSRVVFT